MYELTAGQYLPISIEQAWDFLSSPRNLSVITPPKMNFRIHSGAEKKMYPGQLIVYTVTPLAGIPLRWVTEITHVKEQRFFVDEQRFGPYSFWHHKHFLTAVPGGVLMEDLIHYQIPFGLLGDIAQYLVVRKQLETIFSFRKQKLTDLFGPATAEAQPLQIRKIG